MSPQNARRRPAANGTATVERELGGSLHIVPSAIDTDQWPTSASSIGTTFVVVVTLDQDRQRRRPYFNLPSAARAVDRARARGQRADVVLCALQPVPADAEVAQ